MNPGIITLVLIIANIAISYKGFKDPLFYNRYKFQVDHVLLYKQYIRLISSCFLHVNWTHLVFNMMGLLFLGMTLEGLVGSLEFVVIYFGGLLGGGLLALLIHKQHGYYSSVGASGAIGGIFFAFIALQPSAPISLFFIPISFPAWVFGLAYMAYSIYGIRSRKSNIGHEDHLGGALVGMLVAILFHPGVFLVNYWIILLITVPTLSFIYIIVTRPHVLLVDSHFFKKQKHYYSIDHQYNEDKSNKQKDIDRILDKIGKKGIASLSRDEKKRLEEYSKS